MYTDGSGKEVDLTLEYSPSQNTKRFQTEDNPHERVIENFLKVLSEDTQKAKENYQLKSDIRYGGSNDNQLMDIFFKEKENGTPIFVFIHGGFWQFLDKSYSGSFVAPLVERNYRVINVDYNLCPVVGLKEMCEQMWNFYNWLYKYAKETQASSLIICGHSAGAHLSTLLFLEKSLKLNEIYSVKTSFFLISGLYDLRELWKLECTNSKNILDLSAHSAEELSPICWELSEDVLNFHREHKTEIHVLVAENDSRTFKGQSEALADKWSKLNLNISLKIFDNYDHFDIIEECSKEDSLISKYIIENLE